MSRILLISSLFLCSCLNKNVVEKQVSLFHHTSQSISSYLDWRKLVVPELENSCGMVYSVGERRLFDVIDLQHQQIQSLMESALRIRVKDRRVESLVKK